MSAAVASRRVPVKACPPPPAPRHLRGLEQAGRIDHIIRNRRREGGQRRPPAKEWLHEIKHDSFRVIAHKDGAPRRSRLSAAAPSVIVLRSACGANRTLIRHRRMTGSDPATDMGRIEVPYRSESLT